MNQAHEYIADLRPRGVELDPVAFSVSSTYEGDQPWLITSDLGCDTHHTLDELLFWNLINGERHISEAFRQSILGEFNKAEWQQ